jgi:putative restriction endonuclease
MALELIYGMAVPELLVASHIIPWSDDESRRADPTNGLCLNSLYDRAFDRGLITFDEKFRMVVSTVLKKDAPPEFRLVNFVKMEGSKLLLPHRFCPDTSALGKHRNKIFLP